MFARPQVGTVSFLFGLVGGTGCSIIMKVHQGGSSTLTYFCFVLSLALLSSSALQVLFNVLGNVYLLGHVDSLSLLRSWAIVSCVCLCSTRFLFVLCWGARGGW